MRPLASFRPAREVAARSMCVCNGFRRACSRDVIGCPESPRGPSNGRRRTPLSTSQKLYAENCRGCHGAQGEMSGAIALDNPMYLAVVPRDTLRTIIATGVAGTAMIGFSEEHGGPLTEKQIDILVEGISAWAKNPPSGALPAYSGPLGNAGQGEAAFATLLRELPWRRRKWRESRLRNQSGLRGTC